MGCDSLRILFLETDPLCCNIFVPNAFSPNGDDLNDEFIIRGIFQDYNLIIADRWGNMVFKSRDANVGWNGKFRGEKWLLEPITIFSNISVTIRR